MQSVLPRRAPRVLSISSGRAGGSGTRPAFCGAGRSSLIFILALARTSQGPMCIRRPFYISWWMASLKSFPRKVQRFLAGWCPQKKMSCIGKYRCLAPLLGSNSSRLIKSGQLKYYNLTPHLFVSKYFANGMGGYPTPLQAYNMTLSNTCLNPFSAILTKFIKPYDDKLLKCYLQEEHTELCGMFKTGSRLVPHSEHPPVSQDCLPQLDSFLCLCI